MLVESDDEWLAPFSSECNAVTPVPYGDLHSVSPYVATPQAAIDLILEELKLNSEDFLIDLGCGLGTINISAAVKYKTPGLGVDIDKDLEQMPKKNPPKEKTRCLISIRSLN